MRCNNICPKTILFHSLWTASSHSSGCNGEAEGEMQWLGAKLPSCPLMKCPSWFTILSLLILHGQLNSHVHTYFSVLLLQY
uniref:Uncharacterized protein MANES_13G078600 n=1 Tax=Rhizophora mucronata TaxID=61149 RepID=A0A2P2MGM3_RHIMU